MKKLIVLAAALCMVATSAYAADWNFYGSARVLTQYTKVEVGTASNTNLGEWLATNARIGANVKVSDELAGRFEYGTGNGGNANIRLLYGEWNFGAGSLTIGQDDDPLLTGLSNSVYSLNTTSLDDANMLVFGNTYGSRNAQLKLKFGDFQIAAVAPKAALDVASGAVGSQKVMLPKIVASYRLAQDNWWVKLAGGYQTYNVYSGANQTGTDQSVDSYLGNLSAGVALGALNFRGTVWAGQNPGNIIFISVSDVPAGALAAGGLASYNVATATLTDNDGMGYQLVASYQINDMFTLETGVGYAKTEFDTAAAVDDDVIMYYIQAPITLAPGVTVTPEIGKVDYKEDSILAPPQGENTYFAVKWQINF